MRPTRDENPGASNSSLPEAPWYHVPPRELMSVEHPCLVKNVEKGIEMLGGPEAISEALQDPASRTLSLSFHPEDDTSRKVLSMNSKTNNVLIKVTVPKRTGRKRKRGTEGAFVEDTTETTPRKDARWLLRSLQDNTGMYDLEPVGSTQTTHIWRSMPDFVYSLKGSKFISDFRSKTASKEYPLIKEWTLPRTYGLTDTETLPPPVFSTVTTTNNYSYRQNPAVKRVTDGDGATRQYNTQAPIKIHTQQCQHDTPVYPSNIPEDCPPLSSQPPNLQTLAKFLSTVFEQRPIWSRRALLNQFPPNFPLAVSRYAIAYVAFNLRSGPWRDTFCALGHDPRKSPEYRKYQTILLQLVPKLKDKEDSRNDYQRIWSRNRDTSSHIFTGTGRIPEDGKVWQLCDIIDPQLKPLVDIPDRFIRGQCETRYFGWYANGTSSKTRIILKAKTDYLTEHNGKPEDPAVYESFLALPEEWDGPVEDEHGRLIEDVVHGYLGKDASSKQLEWASAYRSMCRTPAGTVPNSAASGRLSRSKPATRPSYLESQTRENESIAAVTNSEGAAEDTMVGYEEPEEGEEDDDLAGDGDDNGDIADEVEAEVEVQEDGNIFKGDPQQVENDGGNEALDDSTSSEDAFRLGADDEGNNEEADMNMYDSE